MSKQQKVRDIKVSEWRIKESENVSTSSTTLANNISLSLSLFYIPLLLHVSNYHYIMINSNSCLEPEDVMKHKHIR